MGCPDSKRNGGPEYNFSTADLELANDYLEAYQNVVDGSGGIVEASLEIAAHDIAVASTAYNVGRRAFITTAGFLPEEFNGTKHSQDSRFLGYVAEDNAKFLTRLKLDKPDFIPRVKAMYEEAYRMNEEFDTQRAEIVKSY